MRLVRVLVGIGVLLSLCLGAYLGSATRSSTFLKAEASTSQSNPTVRDGIWSGMIEAQTPFALGIKTVSLVVAVGGTLYSLPDQAIAISPSPSINRLDLIQFNGTTISVKQGTVDSVMPTPDPGYAPLSALYVTSISTAIYDMSSMAGSPPAGQGAIMAYYYSRKGLYYSISSSLGLKIFLPEEGMYEFGVQAVTQSSFGYVQIQTNFGFRNLEANTQSTGSEALFLGVKRMPAGLNNVIGYGTTGFGSPSRTWLRSLN